MLQIGIDDYSLNDDEETLGWAILETFEDMSVQNVKALLEAALLRHELTVEDLVVCIACKAYEKAMTGYVTGKDELGLVNAHEMQHIVEHSEDYVKSGNIEEMLWDCLNQVMDEAVE